MAPFPASFSLVFGLHLHEDPPPGDFPCPLGISLSAPAGLGAGSSIFSGLGGSMAGACVLLGPLLRKQCGGAMGEKLLQL